MAKRPKKRVRPESCPFDDLAPRFYWGPLDLPKLIFLAPIQLRSREQCYKDICEDVARELDGAWERDTITSLLLGRSTVRRVTQDVSGKHIYHSGGG